MRRHPLIFVTVGLLIAASDPVTEAAKKDLERFQGKWHLTSAERDGKKKVYLAIYEIDDEHQKICFAAPGKDRPTAFSSIPGSGHLLQVWKREKK